MTRYFNYKNSNHHHEILQKTILKILGDPPGFEPRTFRLWDLHATKELHRFVTVEKEFLWYIKTYLVLKRFLYYSLPNLESQRINSQNFHVAT